VQLKEEEKEGVPLLKERNMSGSLPHVILPAKTFTISPYKKKRF
jgi:hypothetical protein